MPFRASPQKDERAGGARERAPVVEFTFTIPSVHTALPVLEYIYPAPWFTLPAHFITSLKASLRYVGALYVVTTELESDLVLPLFALPLRAAILAEMDLIVGGKVQHNCLSRRRVLSPAAAS